MNFGDEVSIVNEPTSVSPFILPFPEPDILRSMRPGNLVYISDGTVCLEVQEVTPELEVKTHVRNGGNLSSYKGVNLPDVPIDMPVITESDKIALQFGVEQDVDWVALSFVRTGEDVRYARAYLNQLGSRAPVMAKLERRECIANLDEILDAVDGIMVARGDLGVEMPMEEVPVIQKDMVTRANRAGRISSVATQMLRSMVNSPTPTRAEVSDIANAVLDGCDSILLSDEIAVGSYPVEAVRIADAAIVQAEKMYHYYSEFPQRDQTQSVTWGATQLAKVAQRQAHRDHEHRARRLRDVALPARKRHHRVLPRRGRAAPRVHGLGPQSQRRHTGGTRRRQAGHHAGRRGHGHGDGFRARRGNPRPRVHDRRYRHDQYHPGAEHPGISGPHWPERGRLRRAGIAI